MKLFFILPFLVLASSLAVADEEEKPPPSGLIHNFHPFNFDLKEPERPRGLFWPEIGSLILPGLDQWLEGQNAAGLLYSGMAFAGVEVANSAGTVNLDDSSVASQLTEGSDAIRAYILGNKIIETAGELSLYHSFRSAVRTRQAQGDFAFLTKENEETTDQLMLAPFHFAYLARPTTYIPIGLIALSVLTSPTLGHQMRMSDAFYASSNSYCAGVGEESLFRGYLNPVFMNSFDNFFWSNTTASLIFGAAHIASDNEVPVFQFLFGWYLGWLSRSNQWTLSEGIFIHAWWDVLGLLYSLSDHSSVTKVVSLPLFEMTF